MTPVLKRMHESKTVRHSERSVETQEQVLPFASRRIRMTPSVAGAPKSPLVLYSRRKQFLGRVMHLHRVLCALLATASGFPVLRAQNSAPLPRRLGITAGLNAATI